MGKGGKQTVGFMTSNIHHSKKTNICLTPHPKTKAMVLFLEGGGNHWFCDQEHSLRAETRLASIHQPRAPPPECDSLDNSVVLPLLVVVESKNYFKPNQHGLLCQSCFTGRGSSNPWCFESSSFQTKPTVVASHPQAKQLWEREPRSVWFEKKLCFQNNLGCFTLSSSLGKQLSTPDMDTRRAADNEN